jgi:hypothetical protein
MTSSLPMKHHEDSNSLLNKTFSRFLKTRGVYWGSVHILKYLTNKFVPFLWIDHFVDDFSFIHRDRFNVLNLRLSTFFEDSSVFQQIEWSNLD